MPSFKDATLDDLAVVSTWLRGPKDCADWAGSRVGYPIEVDLLASRIEWPIARSMGLFSKARLLGFGQIVPKPNDRLHLARLIVDPDLRDRGLGRNLAARLLDLAMSGSGRAISLNVSPDNAPAVSLYISLGFTRAERPRMRRRRPPSTWNIARRGEERRRRS